MKDDHGFDGLLDAALRRRGLPPPFTVDVADRVMARISAFGPAPRAEIGLRQFVRWAAAAAVVGAALLAAAAWQGPSLAEVVATLGHTTAGTLGAALKLSAPAGSLAGSVGRVGLALLAAFQTLVRLLTPFQPFAHTMLGAIAAAMLGITIFVVGRDVSRRVAGKEHA